jgi:hypothetical protein
MISLMLMISTDNWASIIQVSDHTYEVFCKIPAYAIGSVAAFWMIQRVVAFWD